jgi:hypothetical protein
MACGTPAGLAAGELAADAPASSVAASQQSFEQRELVAPETFDATTAGSFCRPNADNGGAVFGSTSANEAVFDGARVLDVGTDHANHVDHPAENDASIYTRYSG